MCGSSLSPFNIHDNDRVGILTGDITTVHQSCYASLRYNTCCNIKVMMLIQVCVYEKIYNDWTFNLDSYLNSIPSLWNNNNNNNTNQWESLFMTNQFPAVSACLKILFDSHSCDGHWRLVWDADAVLCQWASAERQVSHWLDTSVLTWAAILVAFTFR